MCKSKTVSNRENRKLLLAIMAVALIVSLLLEACEPLAPIQIQNNTDQTLSIFVWGKYEGDVAPNATLRTTKTILDPKYNIELKNPQGEIVYKRTITDGELKMTGERRLVITAADLKQ